MPRQLTRTQSLNTFSGGLNTEANPLAFPEGTLKDADNVDVLRNGTARWRRSLAFEEGGNFPDRNFSPTDMTDKAISSHEWLSVENQDSLNFHVVQVGSLLLFHQKGTDKLSASYVGQVNLGPSGAQDAWDMVSGQGKLFVVSKNLDPFYVSYDVDTNTFSTTTLNLKVRDVDGIDDGLAIDERPTTISPEHRYNLRNQGWPLTFVSTLLEAGSSGTVVNDPIDYTFSSVGFYPSNADIIFYAKLASAEAFESINAYSPWQISRFAFGNTPAAKGHFILPAFDRNRTTASGIAGLYDEDRDLDPTRPIAVEFYTGRIWYLMPDGRVLYSQILTDLIRAENCYQEADPTAEDINELVATDGGEIDVTGVSQGLRLQSVNSELVILSNNGVWSISGGAEAGFSATQQEIRKISNIGSVGRETLIEAEGTIFYWSKGGIYTLATNQVSGLLEAQNITDQTIQDLYLSISDEAKVNARGFYDQQDKKLIWLFNDTPEYDGISSKYKYNRALIFDIVLGAFYTYTFSTDNEVPFIAALTAKDLTREQAVESFNHNEYSDYAPETAIDYCEYGDIELKVKALTFVKITETQYKYTFSEFGSHDMKDWMQYDGDGVFYKCYAETGANIAEDLISEKEIMQLYLFMKRTETAFVPDGEGNVLLDRPSGANMFTKWHWSSSSSSNRWSEPEQSYRLNREYIPSGIFPEEFDYGFDVIQTINQIRGKGRAISIRFDSEDGKDFHLLGWASPLVLMTAG